MKIIDKLLYIISLTFILSTFAFVFIISSVVVLFALPFIIIRNKNEKKSS